MCWVALRLTQPTDYFTKVTGMTLGFLGILNINNLFMFDVSWVTEVLNVKILKIMTKLCIRSDDTKKYYLLTPFSIVKQLSISKILVL
jgi:hypothetical protein